MNERRWKWPVAVVAALAFVVLGLELFLPHPPGSIRPVSLRTRVEIMLEKCGVINHDLFRHIEGLPRPPDRNAYQAMTAAPKANHSSAVGARPEPRSDRND